MTDEQHDLFADDHEMVGQLFDKLDHIPDTELSKYWCSGLNRNLADKGNLMMTKPLKK